MRVQPGGLDADGRLLWIDVRVSGGWTNIELVGMLDVATARDLYCVFDEVMARSGGRPQVLVQLRELDFCDSSGLNVLIKAWKQIIAADGALILLRPRPRIRDLMARVGLDRYFDIRDSPPG